VAGPGWGGEEGSLTPIQVPFVFACPLLCLQRAPLVGDMGAAAGVQLEHLGQIHPVPKLDVFDGIAVKTPGGLRFADADQVADITDR
jgi:hypothetical protein